MPTLYSVSSKRQDELTTTSAKNVRLVMSFTEGPRSFRCIDCQSLYYRKDVEDVL